MSLLGASALVASAFLGTSGTSAAHATSGVTEITGAGLPSGVSCFWYSGASGSDGAALYGIRCTVSTTLGGDPTDGSEPGPIPLATNTGVIHDLNQWLTTNSIASSIEPDSLVGIETIGGQGRNGDSCGACNSGNGGSPGYAISVQTLGGMQQLIANSSYYADGDVPGNVPALYVFVGAQGEHADSHQGGGGGSSSMALGISPSVLSLSDAQSSADKSLVFAIGGGGGGGGGVYGSTGSGDHGGDGGTMTSTGPQTGGDTAVAGTDGSGGDRAGIGGNTDGGGAGGGGGAGNDGSDGVGGLGGWHSETETAGWVGTDFDAWGAGHGGKLGGDEDTGGGGGGGWGGGGGGGQHENKGGNFVGRGGGGGGTWARKSVDSSGMDSLPTLYNDLGSGFKLSDYYSTVFLSFSLIPTAGAPGEGDASSSTSGAASSSSAVVAAASSSASSTSAAAGPAELASTGTETAALLAALAALVSAGTLLLLLGRRRQSH